MHRTYFANPASRLAPINNLARAATFDPPQVQLTSAPEMPITHIVLFGFKPNASPSAKQAVADNFLALKEKCTKPDGTRYILSLTGGKQTSPEGKGKGLQYGFVVEFENAEDRQYYLEQDAAHLAFGAGIRDVVNDACVFDFTPGEF